MVSPSPNQGLLCTIPWYNNEEHGGSTGLPASPPWCPHESSGGASAFCFSLQPPPHPCSFPLKEGPLCFPGVEPGRPRCQETDLDISPKTFAESKKGRESSLLQFLRGFIPRPSCCSRPPNISSLLSCLCYLQRSQATLNPFLLAGAVCTALPPSEQCCGAGVGAGFYFVTRYGAGGGEGGDASEALHEGMAESCIPGCGICVASVHQQDVGLGFGSAPGPCMELGALVCSLRRALCHGYVCWRGRDSLMQPCSVWDTFIFPLIGVSPCGSSGGIFTAAGSLDPNKLGLQHP